MCILYEQLLIKVISRSNLYSHKQRPPLAVSQSNNSHLSMRFLCLVTLNNIDSLNSAEAIAKHSKQHTDTKR